MKKTIRLTESDLLSIIKKVIKEQEYSHNQEIVTNYKNEILIFQKELDLFINAIDELIKIPETSDVEVKVNQKSDAGINWNLSSTDYFSKNLNEWLVTYSNELKKYNEILKKVISTKSFDVNTQSYAIDRVKFKKMYGWDKYAEKEKTDNEKLIREGVYPVFEKFIPIVKRFIKSCERFGEFDKKNRGNLVKSIGWSDTFYEINDIERLIFSFRTFTGAKTVLFFLKKFK